jgi:hypothetical protein
MRLRDTQRQGVTVMLGSDDTMESGKDKGHRRAATHRILAVDAALHRVRIEVESDNDDVTRVAERLGQASRRRLFRAEPGATRTPGSTTTHAGAEAYARRYTYLYTLRLDARMTHRLRDDAKNGLEKGFVEKP